MERRKVRKRTKNKASAVQAAAPSDSTSVIQEAEADVEKKPEGDDLEDESVYRKKELEELEGLISPDVKADIGANPTGLYELIGACEPHSVLTENYWPGHRLPSQSFGKLSNERRLRRAEYSVRDLGICPPPIGRDR